MKGGREIGKGGEGGDRNQCAVLIIRTANI